MSDFNPQVDEAKASLAQLNTVNLDDSTAHKDAILQCQSVINALQRPGDKALESFTTVWLAPSCRKRKLTTAVYHLPLSSNRK